jgi:hypothetical protein
MNFDLDFRSLDLIYGMPGDNYESFKKTVDIGYEIGKQRLFVHGLMIIPGSCFYENPQEFDIKFIESPPWNILENNTYSFEDMKKTKVLHIGQELVARMFPITFDYLLNEEKPSLEMKKFGEKLLDKGIVTLDVDLFDWMRKLKGYDDGFRKKVLKVVLEEIKDDVVRELALYESFNYLLYYLNLHFVESNYSFIKKEISFSDLEDANHYISLIRDYQVNYPIHNIKTKNDIQKVQKLNKPIKLIEILDTKKFTTPIKT